MVKDVTGSGTTGVLVVVRGGDTVYKIRGAMRKVSDELERDKLRACI